MKDEIKVGEYIRTPYFTIEKVEKINKAEKNIYEDIVITDTSAYGLSWLKKHKTKHSPNLIDLIEEGDYVNGHRIVNEIYGEDDNELYFEIEGGFNKADYISEKDIKSIVTKEQFKSVEYEV